MAKEGGTLRVLVGSILLVLPLACGDNGNGPMDTGNDDVFNVSGTWTVTSTLVEEDCEGVEFLPVVTDQVVIQHSGSQITFVVEELGTVSGTIDVKTGDFEIDVTVSDPDLGTLRLQEMGRFTSETQYTSEEIITFEDEDLACQARTMDVGTRLST